MLTIDVIRAAQNNDLAATTAVIEATDSRVAVLADQAARRMAPHGGARLADYREEFTQVGRIAVWELLSRFTDDTAEAFLRLTYTTVDNRLKDAVRDARNVVAGADENAMKTFAAMVEAADGDVYEAAKLAQTLPPKGRRLSADRAEAARLAWQGAVSIDKTAGPGGDQHGGGTIADTIAHFDEELDGEIRPKVGVGAASEAVHVLMRYVTVPKDEKAAAALSETLSACVWGYPTLPAVETLEDVVRVPSDPTERRYVLDAMAVLRSAVSTAMEGALDDDLRDARDERMAESSHKHERVRSCLDSMGQAQRDVLKHSFGIGGATDFGWGDGCDMDGLCEALGMSYANVKAHRSKGRKAFAKRYVAAVALTGAATYAAVLEAAAAANLKPAGRK
ncbi:sigma-70 family RNA polymerase sigma factor [Streptomyces sp. NPDC046832]|uniref:sigma-70 family RNA polymerase sigma factor n=1 Tax=Streptomyces sp. NPDC046832 TaxID=3155020 RepID=UPI0034046672